MRKHRIDIATIRREQIVEAAVSVITEKGLQNLSLSEIETRADMSRGQLTYYFPTKEDILLAVFERLLVRMYDQLGSPPAKAREEAGGWELMEYLAQNVPGNPLLSPEFHCLQYTFLSQIGHREDFRRRLASLYEEWRCNLDRSFSEDLANKPACRHIDTRMLATLIQGFLHGLTLQKAADPQAFQGPEIMHLFMDMLGTYLWGKKSHEIENGNGNGKNGVPVAIKNGKK